MAWHAVPVYRAQNPRELSSDEFVPGLVVCDGLTSAVVGNGDEHGLENE